MSLMSACESPEGPNSLIHSQGNTAARTAATQGGQHSHGSRAYEMLKAISLFHGKSPKPLCVCAVRLGWTPVRDAIALLDHVSPASQSGSSGG
ncbi:hypothetical protein [Nostoc sp. 2RC]|uniref:hypothetical protein n=1 Tax=Nostoc sp. 2RC TaxID=2485484 RepID=UPI001625008A|nr:hypothetical protein [Nostoc sp. 2RC]MBC1235650.1 hypothetical protein [Nostoc sp. 2RC]